LLKVFTNVLVLDHHEIDENSLACSLRIIDTSSSSTCEMICELIKESHITISPYLATILLSGIVLDTNNFTLKTKASTYYYAYYLTSLGASSREVQYLLKQDLGEYIKRQKPITNVIMINNHIALTKGEKNTIYRREDLAKMADTLIMFNEIEASFVIGKLNKTTVGISARSLGSIEVNKILNKLNGGGDKFNAASKISDKTVKEVEEDLKDLLKEEK
ncbi:MAG: DHHA1 domain-containing protein, partial [Bacilli bacterium]